MAGSGLYAFGSRHPLSGTHCNPSRTGAEIPKNEHRVHQPGTRCWRPLGSQDQGLRSLPRRVHPARVPQSEARASPRAPERAGGAGGRSLAGFPAFKRSFPEPPGALAPFVSGVRTTGQKRTPCTSLPRSGPLPGGSPRKAPTQPRALLSRPESSPRGGLRRGPGRAGAAEGLWALPLAEGEGRSEGHSPRGRRPAGSRTLGARGCPGAAATQARV